MKLSPERCSWFHRVFQSGIDITLDQDRRVVDYCDFLINTTTREKFKNLISEMYKNIAAENINELEGPTLESYITQDNNFISYLDMFKLRMIDRLSVEFRSVIERVQSWEKDGNGIGFPGQVVNEMIHHCKILYDKCKTFQGREDLIQDSLQYIRSNDDERKLLEISLSIIGISGCGKTALMSKLAVMCQSIFPDIPIIIRYCGTSKGSVDGLVLITSICQQIQLVNRLELITIPVNYQDAVKYFHKLLSTHPVILFIDSLDQLTDSFQARSKLSFLVGVKCHPDTRIIVSALPDDKDPVTNIWGKYVYLCDTRLVEFKVPRVVVTAFEVVEAKSILSGMLAFHNRKLTDAQTESVLTSISYEPTALYLALAVNIVRHWTSADSSQKRLHGTVYKLINQIFDQLELDYGISLTRFAVGFIAFSKSGKL